MTPAETSRKKRMQRKFSRVAIVNRGEAAMRFIHAVEEHNREHTSPLTTIALYTTADRDACFTREAHESYCLGPATRTTEQGETQSAYLDYNLLRQALTQVRADAVWVGWGFVAEQAEFAELCQNLGIVFIGPPPDVMRELGNKITAKHLAESAKVPVARWSGGPVPSVAAAETHADEIGYPLLIKAASGGGGRGIRKVTEPSGLSSAFTRAQEEAKASFGDPTVFIEELLPRARHIEVQVIADNHGTVQIVGIRDCTIQRRNQKVIEESGSVVLDPADEKAARTAALRLCQTVGYQNAGTVEFLYLPAKDNRPSRLAFMEVNTRLQVEHPVTEVTTGLDLVKLQLHVAKGGHLNDTPPPTTGHAIEARLNAEDPERDFAPAPGKIAAFRLPTGPGIRVDTGVREGDSIPAEFDSMIAKIIVWGQNRQEALARLERALAQCTIVVKGGTTNKAFLLSLLQQPEVKASTVDIDWLNRLTATGAHINRKHAEIALVQAAIEAYDAETAVEQARFYSTAARGRPQVRNEIGVNIEFRLHGGTYSVHVDRLQKNQYRVQVENTSITAEIRKQDKFERRLTCFGQTHRVISVIDGPDHLIEVDGVPHRVSRDDGGIVRALAPSVVVRILVAPGDKVHAGETIAILESMKMETAVAAPFSGQIRAVHATSNTQVDAGTPLLQIDAEERPSSGMENDETRLLFHREKDQGNQTNSMDLLQSQMLGFDISAADAFESIAHTDQTDAREKAILEIFADICSISRRERETDVALPGENEDRRSPSEHFLLYLRAVESAGTGLPSTFLDQLLQTLSHYGVESFDHSPELEEALLLLFKSHQRIERQAPVITAILHRQLKAYAGQHTLDTPANFEHLLDRLASSTTSRFPEIADIAREIRYTCFDKPILDKKRSQVYAEMDEHIAAIRDPSKAIERAQNLKALIQCPLPLRARLTHHVLSEPTPLRQTLLEILAKRYYPDHDFSEFWFPDTEAGPIAVSQWVESGNGPKGEDLTVSLLTLATTEKKLDHAVQNILGMADSLPPDHVAEIDFHLSYRDSLPMEKELSTRLLALLHSQQLPKGLRRATFMAATSTPSVTGEEQYFTFRPTQEATTTLAHKNPDKNGDSPTQETLPQKQQKDPLPPLQQAKNQFIEDRLVRGMHPAIAERRRLWRLANFDIERLPVPGNVVALFRGKAKENPKDERFFALAEVHDLTEVRDKNGTLLAVPELEHVLLDAFSTIRSARTRHPERDRMVWNRVMLSVRPPLRYSSAEIQRIAQKLAGATEGTGLEAAVVQVQMRSPRTGRLRPLVLHMSNPTGTGFTLKVQDPPTTPLVPLTEYTQKVVKMRRRGLHYPYETVEILAPSTSGNGIPGGSFVEYDLEPSKDAANTKPYNYDDQLVPVRRPHGQNKANIVLGIVQNHTEKYPEGMERVILLSDPSRGLGSLAEEECRRIIAALSLAEKKRLPVEWFATSSGARISMESGTENMDWIGRVLRRIVEFTQKGGEINVVVCGVNVGAQPYWNAEATMLTHTKGILIMMPESAMVLTGKQALDYSGGVSAEDNLGIGGFERVMGPNGQAQYWAKDLRHSCKILLQYYEHSYIKPGERFPRRAVTTDLAIRDISRFPHPTEGFQTVGDIFHEDTNPGRKKPFDIRTVMRAVIDQDLQPLERWFGLAQGGETAVVWDAHVGGIPMSLLGMESRPLPRQGLIPADGPDAWTSGTLFPQSSRKIARALNAVSGNRPVVILANLSGFDGSPESLRKLQLEYGAEIGRAVVNFKGPIVFCVLSRYHGGAFVVFSGTLNDNMTVVALEGAKASVIGGAPAAAVVFAKKVRMQTEKDKEISALQQQISNATDSTAIARLQTEFDEAFIRVHAEQLGQIANEFDAIHTIERAHAVGSVHEIITAIKLRSFLIEKLGQTTSQI